MLDKDNVLIFSICLFLIGFTGTIGQSKITKICISIEIMFFASALNFCYATDNATTIGHITIFFAAMLHCLTLATILLVLFLHFKQNKDLNMFDKWKI